MPRVNALTAPSSTTSAPATLTAPAIQRLRAVAGSASGMNQVTRAPPSIAASGCSPSPRAITMRQPAAIAIRAAASFVTMPPEL